MDDRGKLKREGLRERTEKQKKENKGNVGEK
jgi:hypothetical protein